MAKAVTTTSDRSLAKEYATYKLKLPELTNEQGKFALIHGDDLAGVFPTYENALLAGYKKFGIKQPFLVKQIVAVETPIYLR
jgi:hypothetical protein